MNKLEDNLEQRFKKILEDLNVFEYIYKISPMMIKGKNFTTLVSRIEVRGKNKNDEEVQMHFVVKNAPVHTVLRKVHATRVTYLREIYGYENVFPSFLDLEKSYGVPELFKSYPKYYASSKTELEEFLVMEDMKDLGYESYDKENIKDFDHAMLLMKELGKFHALSFALRKKKFEVFREIRDQIHDIEYHSEFEATSDYTINLLSNKSLQSLDPQQDREAYDKFDNFRKRILDVTKSLLTEVVNLEHVVVTHGDFWLPNLLFKYQDGVPSEVCMLDWQFLRIGSPAFDISQLLFNCCDKEVRNKFYVRLIETYYKNLTSCLKFFGEDAEEMFPFKVLLEHLKKYSVVGLISSLRTTFVMTRHDNDIPDLKDITNTEECVGMYVKAKRNEEMYNRIMKSIILDYINFGYNI